MTIYFWALLLESWPNCQMSHGFLHPSRRMLVACTETGHHSGARLTDCLSKTSRDGTDVEWREHGDVGWTVAVDREYRKEDVRRGVFEEAYSRGKWSKWGLWWRGSDEEKEGNGVHFCVHCLYCPVATFVFTVCIVLLPPLDSLKFLWLICVELSCLCTKGLATGLTGHNGSCKAQPVSDQDLSPVTRSQ